MDNFLDNGSVLPFGLLDHNSDSLMDGFNKTYKNYPLRVGMIVECFPVGHPSNLTKLTTEYNVLVFEQQEDSGSSLITYRNVVSAEGLGSITDFFEKTLRTQTKKNDSYLVNTAGQNGSIVLLLCLDGISEKAIIVGALTHPDRKTTLTDSSPHLEGEYNGVRVVVNSDGSTSLTFKGATDNNGLLLDSTQGNTTASIEKDGSFQLGHKTITQRFDKNGKASLTADDDISNTTKTNFNVTTGQDVVVQANADIRTKSIQFVLEAQGTASFAVQQMSVQAQSAISFQGSQINVQAQALASVKAPSISLEGNVSLGGSGGNSLLMSTTQIVTIIGGTPFIGTPVSGFTTKVTAL